MLALTQEEVNELATHPKGEYLAAADDSGVVKVFNTRTKRLHKTLRNVHSVRTRFPHEASGQNPSSFLSRTTTIVTVAIPRRSLRYRKMRRERGMCTSVSTFPPVREPLAHLFALARRHFSCSKTQGLCTVCAHHINSAPSTLLYISEYLSRGALSSAFELGYRFWGSRQHFGFLVRNRWWFLKET